MNALHVTFAIWAIVAAAFVAAVVYRATLNNHETDQIYLNDSEDDSFVEEHNRIVDQTTRLQPLCTGLGAATIVATLALIGVYLFQQLPYIHF